MSTVDLRPVRGEDAVDVAAVAAWIREHCAGDPLLDGVDLGTATAPVLPEIRQFAGGASNLTYLLTYPGRELVLRRPPRGTKAASAHDMRREYEVQRGLEGHFPLVPHVLGLCEDPTVAGAPFYVMERLTGTVLRRDLPGGVSLDILRARTLSERALDTLAELHSVDPHAVGLGHLDRGDGYVRRQVEGWSRRFRAARTPDVPDFEPVMRWLEERQPDDVRHCLVHNDFRFDNLVLDPGDPTRIVGMLDWEMATVGDPLMDLSAAMAYWVEAQDGRFMHAFRRQPTHLPGMLTRREAVFRYTERTGLRVSTAAWRFYHVFGLFRLAVIAQQIHYRRYHRQTTDPAFAQFGLAVVMLEQRCLQVMRGGGPYRRFAAAAVVEPRGRRVSARVVAVGWSAHHRARVVLPLVRAGIGRGRDALRRR